jgi:RNA recognition motif-containing protein
MASKSLYVGNLPYSSTEASLSAAFAAYGCSNVRIIEGRGFAFIDVADDQVANAIEAMNGKSLDGRTLTVNEARPRGSSDGGARRDNSYSSGGGGGRSGGGGGSSRGGRW